MRGHTKLRAFRLADELALLAYRVTSRFPREELYGLTAQMRRAAISIPSNIAEGCARDKSGRLPSFSLYSFRVIERTSLSNKFI